MIFAVVDHIQQIKDGTKTQTRRRSTRYSIGGMYKIQPKRTAKGIPDGCILIMEKWTELKIDPIISVEDAKAEGGYTPEEYERLYEKMNRFWTERTAYKFEFISSVQLPKKKSGAV